MKKKKNIKKYIYIYIYIYIYKINDPIMNDVNFIFRGLYLSQLLSWRSEFLNTVYKFSWLHIINNNS